MNPIERLIEADAKTKKRIAVLGCSMEDRYVHGDILPSQDGVMKFVERRTVSTPGGAAGASRQLFHWNAHVELISLVGKGDDSEAWNQIGIGAKEVRRMPKKVRFLDDQGRIVWRHDLDNGYGLDANGMEEIREAALEKIRAVSFDAVLISDYEKGFVDHGLIREVIRCCNKDGIPVIADAKRHPRVYEGAFLKCNNDYSKSWGDTSIWHFKGVVVTRGERSAIVASHDPLPPDDLHAVQCRNHVGAGDSFAAHLTLALAHGFSLKEAATFAHSAGRVYVQHLHGRPPWSHELRKDLDPVGGKVVISDALTALRRSSSGRIVFAPGVFRFIHAGHAAFLEWAKAQGDVLVVGVNSDASAKELRSGKTVLPLEERVRILASMSAVDWIVPFDWEPREEIRKLQPDLMVKGHDYASGLLIACTDIAKEVRIAPESAFTRHCSDY